MADFGAFIYYFLYLGKGCISNSGENYDLFGIPADKPNTALQSRQD